MSASIKLLIVVMDFYQAGAQRFAYEVDTALDKTKFEVSILSIRDLEVDKHFADYYYEKHRMLGSRIYFLNNFFKDVSLANVWIRKLFLNRISIKLLPNSISRKISSFIEKRKKGRKELNIFFSQFDVISWMGEYVPTLLFNIIDLAVFNKSVIHLMNAKFQNVPSYHHYPSNIHYTFTSGFDDENQVKHELSEINDYKHIFFTLYLKINKENYQWKFNNSKNKKIGIFTRLDSMKPLDVFFAAFNLLLSRLPEIELHIFGAGDPVQSGMQRLANNFYIADKTFFRGHQLNLVQTAIDEKLDLVWFQGYKNRPAGYAGFDICTTGIPQIFWDFNNSTINSTYDNSVYPLYKNLELFVNKSIDILTNESSAEDLSQNQFNDVVENRDIQKYIHNLENIFIEIASTASTNTQ